MRGGFDDLGAVPCEHRRNIVGTPRIVWKLANASTYVYVKTALTELARELDKTADRLEPKTGEP
jgi:hypothetical protein